MSNRKTRSKLPIVVDRSQSSDDLRVEVRRRVGRSAPSTGEARQLLSPAPSFESGTSTSETDEWKESGDDVDPFVVGKGAETSGFQVAQRNVASLFCTCSTAVSRYAPVFAFAFFLGFVATVWFFNLGGRHRPPPIQLALVAQATSIYIPLALDVVQNLVEVQKAIHPGFQIHQLQFVAERVADDRPRKELEIAIANVHALSTDIIQPRVEIATTLWRLTNSIKTTSELLRTISAAREAGRNDVFTEQRLRHLVRDDLNTIHRSELQQLHIKLSATASRCAEVIMSHGSFADIHPFVRLIWSDDGEETARRRWSWFGRGTRWLDMTVAEAEMQELWKAADGARQQFERAEKVRAVVNRAKESVETYLKAYLELSILNGDPTGHNDVEEGADFQDFFAAVKEQFRELRSLTAEIHHSVHWPYKVWRDTTADEDL